MKLLLDQGLPRSTVAFLEKTGVAAAHVGDLGLAKASDMEILSYGRAGDWVVVTLDADFHSLLVLAAARFPSVIRIRIEGLSGEPLGKLLSGIMAACGDDLAAGAMVSATQSGLRVRKLPIQI